jgi:adenine-specific DNA glycosylase
VAVLLAKATDGGWAVLLQRRPATGLLARQWQPLVLGAGLAGPDGRRVDEGEVAAAAVAAVGARVSVESLAPRGEVTHVFTHLRHRVSVLRAVVRVEEAEDEAKDEEVEVVEVRPAHEWVPLTEAALEAAGLTSWARKLLGAALGEGEWARGEAAVWARAPPRARARMRASA